MNQSQLIRLIKTFNSEQWEELLLYVKSPYCVHMQKNTLERRVKFIKYLRSHVPKTVEPNNPKLNKRVVWRQLFPRKNYQDGRMRQEMNGLKQLIEQYIIHSRNQKNDIEKQLILLDYYANQPNLHKDFDALFLSIKTALNNTPYRDAAWFRHQFNLEYIKSLYLSLNTYQKEEPNIKQMDRQFDLYYFFIKMTHACLFKNHPALRNDLQTFQGSVLDYLDQNPIITEANPSLAVLLQAYHLSSDTVNPSFFYNYVALLNEHIGLFEPIDQKNLYQYAVNYAVRKVNRAKTKVEHNESRKMLHEVYQMIGIGKGAIYIDGKIMPGDMRNIVLNILAMNTDETISTSWKIEALNHFLNGHKDKIHALQSEAIYKVNLALLAFYQKNFKQCLLLIDNLNLPPIIAYILEKRRLEIKCLVQLEAIDELDRAINSFDQALRRALVDRVPVSKRYQEKNINFLNFLKRILHTSTFQNDKRIQMLCQEIQQTPNVATKDWLLTILK